MLELVIEMAGYAPYPILETAFAVFKRTPPQNISEGFLNFLCLYTLNVMKNVQRRKAALKLLKKPPQGQSSKEWFDDKYALHDIGIFWNLMAHSTNEPKIDCRIKDQALNCLIQIADEDEDIGKPYFTKAVTAIKENSPESIRCMRLIVTGYKKLQGKREIARIIKAAVGKDSGMLELVVKGVIKYKQKVNAAVGPSSKNIMSSVRRGCDKDNVGVCGRMLLEA